MPCGSASGSTWTAPRGPISGPSAPTSVRDCLCAFTLADAYTPEELAEAGEDAVCAADRALSLPCYELAQQRVKAFYSGLSTTERRPLTAGLYRVYADGVFLGIGRYDANAQEMYPEKAFPPV